MNYIIGRVKHDNGTYSNKDTLSYSGYTLWKSSKDQYRKRYYLNEKPFETAETIFGKHLHKSLEQDEGDTELRGRIEDDENQIKIIGYLDSFDKDTLKIIDHKSGHLDSKGKVPWDRVKVYKHKQLVWYSLLVILNFKGKFNPVAEIHWHETKFKKKTTEFDGHILETESRELEATGRIEVFPRNIEMWEMEKLGADILQTAKEIHEDYILWQNQLQKTQ